MLKQNLCFKKLQKALIGWRKACPPKNKSFFGHVIGYMCLSQGHNHALWHWESNQCFATFWLLALRSTNWVMPLF